MRDVIKIAIELRCLVWKDDDAWISHCPSLDVYSQGDSQENAQKSIEAAVQLWVESCLERDKLKQALAEVGWRKCRAGEEIPADQDTIRLTRAEDESSESDRMDRIEFPIELQVPAYQANLFAEHRAG